MSYQVLARKYRPQKFSDVIGQEHVTRTLQNAIAQERIAHGYIFSGHRGIGKTTVARILAMALNCRSTSNSNNKPVLEPCGVCDSCTEIRNGNSVDVIEIDAATNRGIDEIRELREAARYRPARDRFKIYILDEAHQITDAAFNALLKTLEEPPSHVIFMMATTQPEDIPQTIRSRCQHFSYRAMKFDDIMGQLREIVAKEKIPADEDALALLAEAGDGSMRDALSILDQAIASTSGHLTLDSVRSLIGSAPAGALETVMQAVAEGSTETSSTEKSSSETILVLVDELISEGHSPTHFARQLVRFLRNVTVAKIAGKDSALLQISSDERARAGRIADLFSEEDLARHLQIMLRTHAELGYRQEQRFHLELGLLKMAHAQRLLPIEQLLSDAAPASGPTRTAPRPVLAPPAETTRAAPSAPARSSSVSPFAADSARKGNPKAEASGEIAAFAGDGARTTPIKATTNANVVIMGSAAPAVEELAPAPDPQPAARTQARTEAGVERRFSTRRRSERPGQSANAGVPPGKFGVEAGRKFADRKNRGFSRDDRNVVHRRSASHCQCGSQRFGGEADQDTNRVWWSAAGGDVLTTLVPIEWKRPQPRRTRSHRATHARKVRSGNPHRDRLSRERVSHW